MCRLQSCVDTVDSWKSYLLCYDKPSLCRLSVTIHLYVANLFFITVYSFFFPQKRFLWKMKVFNWKKFFRTFISYWINVSCLGFVIWQTIQCMTKYIQKPQGTTVSMKNSAHFSFPAISVCGLFGKDLHGYDMGLNETYLQHVCGLR